MSDPRGHKSATVVVVGAGLAGLTAAYRLQQAGIDVQLFEARKRVGGRVLTVKINGNIAEMGAQNIADGGDAPVMKSLVNEFGLHLTGHDVPITHMYYYGEDLICSHTLLKHKQLEPATLKTKLDELASKSRNMRDVLLGLFDEEDVLFKVMASRLACYEGAAIEKLSPVYVETLYRMLLRGVMTDPDKDEEKYYLHLLCIDGGNSLLPEKMGQILDDRLHLDMPLKQVSKDPKGAYLLTFAKGHQVKADKLVLAIPSSLYGDISFDEDVLPPKKLEAFKKMPYGANAKILVPFPNVPMVEQGGMSHDNMVCFFDIDHKILTLYYAGEASQFCEKTILETYKKDRPMIEKGFGSVCPPFAEPIFAEDRPFVDYGVPTGYSWPNDPYCKGSYSYHGAGQDASVTAITTAQGEPVRELFAPVDENLYFGGEHTSILLSAPGTMEAACESGERIARMIVRTTLQ